MCVAVILEMAKLLASKAKSNKDGCQYSPRVKVLAHKSNGQWFESTLS